MKLLAVLALVATSFLPVLPAAADSQRCTIGSDTPNNQSSLSSTSEGGIDCTR